MLGGSGSAIGNFIVYIHTYRSIIDKQAIICVYHLAFYLSMYILDDAGVVMCP